MDLPKPLIMDILSRVPPKALLRFRSVSKSWKELIDDSYFINLHLQHSLKNATNLSLIIKGSKIYTVDFPVLAKAIVMDNPLKRNGFQTELVGSCNGLLCLSNGNGRGKNGTIIYNPVTRNCREVPPSRIEFSAKVTFCARDVDGFGYDLINDDYKFIRIIQFKTKCPGLYDSEVKLFSLKANSWRKLQYFPREYLLSYREGCGKYANGHLHWLVNLNPDWYGPKSIVAFNLSSEVFKDVLLPKYPVGEVDLSVEVLQQRLCLLIHYPSTWSDPRSEVWIMKEYGVDDSWTKLFHVALAQTNDGPFELVRPIAFSKDGSKILLEQDVSECVWYDLQTKRTKKVKIRGMPSPLKAGMLVESLVLGSRKINQKKKRNKNDWGMLRLLAFQIILNQRSFLDAVLILAVRNRQFNDKSKH